MALDFDGVSDTVSYGDMASFDSATLLTVLMWYRPTATDQADLLLGKTTGENSPTFRLGHGVLETPTNNDNFRVYINQSGGLNKGARLAGAFVADTWVHIGFTYNGGGANDAEKLMIYKNGTAGVTAYINSPVSASLPSNANVVRFGETDNGTRDLDGALACVKAWTAKLTAEEVVQEMHMYRPHRTADLILWLPWIDGNAIDFSSGRNTATLSGPVVIGGPPITYGG